MNKYKKAVINTTPLPFHTKKTKIFGKSFKIQNLTLALFCRFVIWAF